MAEQRDPDSGARHVPSHPLARQPAKRPVQRTVGQGRARRPLPPGEQFLTPGATGLRKALERRSAAPLVFMFQLPRWILPVAMVLLMLAGFVLPDWRGGLAVLPVLAFVVWLAYMSWPSLGFKGRVLRVVLSTFLFLLAADRFGAF
ncbi:DUF6703 family protein [Streptosporangium soli]|nr:hypothetical protein [Streptosporangium sp. KLBMP 9127]